MDSLTDWCIRHLAVVVLLPLCLLAVLVVHELGHYMAARLLGLKVGHVSFGRGRLIWSRRDSLGTMWSLYCLPLRAHVEVSDFHNASVVSIPKRLIVILAGPLANLLLPFLLFVSFFALFGRPSIPTIVTSVTMDMPAYKAGLRPGDKILSVDGDPVRSLGDIVDHVAPKRQEDVNLTYQRDGQSHTTSLTPHWTEYRDVGGVLRGYNRIGLDTWQQPYSIEVVRSVQGRPVKGGDEARAALLAVMDQRIEVGMFSMDGKVNRFLIDLSSQSNPHLGDLSHKESKFLYVGTLRDNYYLPLTLSESIQTGAAETGKMIAHVVMLPFNLFPIDKDWIMPEASVSYKVSWLGAALYIGVFFVSLSSCFVGILNLLPFPGLDGGALLLLLAELKTGEPLARKQQAATLVLALLIIYAAIFGANMGDLRGYYTYQIQKLSSAQSD